MRLNFDKIVAQFEFKGRFLSVVPIVSGHINDTYVVCLDGRNGYPSKYILQRINHHVFKDPVSLMGNIEIVTSILSQKIKARGGNPLREALTLIPTIHGATYFISDEGEYWRAYLFIENAHSYDQVEDYSHVYQAARAFGDFQNLMSDCSPDLLNETIPDFHHTSQRLSNFYKAVKADKMNLAHKAQPEIDFVVKRSEETGRLLELQGRGELPIRITHNDTKFNNVLIDDLDGSGICVIDLDTVMPGLSGYDFGDSIRSMANTAAEDEQDLSKVSFDLKVFDRYTDGYLGSAGPFLTPAEIDNLVFSARLMTLECGIRFLTDHLEGDQYFKVSKKDHNLDRCRTQFKLVAEMERLEAEMLQIVARYARKYGLR